MSPFPLPYVEVEFDKSGAPVGDHDFTAVAALLDQGATDVLVISHGWNNDISDARGLYQQLAGHMATLLTTHAPSNWHDRTLAVVGVFWPSMKFADSDEIPGGAASLGEGAGADDVRAQLDDLSGLVDDPAAKRALTQARAHVDDLDTDPHAREEFVRLVRTAMAHTPPGEDTALDAAQLLTNPRESAEDLMQRLAAPLFLAGSARRPAGQGGAADLDPGPDVPPAGGAGDVGGAADVGGLGAMFRSAKNLLNYATYYQMKARSGTVGATGCADLLAAIHRHTPPVRLHLAGHSFGARVVSMAALKASPAPAVSSMSLLQAAFSHYSFATDWRANSDGFFQPVFAPGRLDGPMLVTHTVNDKAVGVAYAIASRLAGQQAQSVGGPDDIYGGLGRNGALSTLDTVDQTLLDVTGTYDLTSGRVHNLLADQFIHSHGDVRGPQVALAVLSAIASAG
jgi:hypothetical protein